MLAFSILFSMQISSLTMDCGAQKNAKLIETTQSLILTRQDFDVPSGPIRKPEHACVRMEFKITPDGKPADIRIVETSRIRRMDLSAEGALRMYTFRDPGAKSREKTFSLVFAKDIE